MALTQASLTSKIKANIEAINDFPNPGIHPLIIDIRFIDAVSKAIVDEIQQNAIVLPDTLNNPSGQPVTVSTSSGVGATTAPKVIQGTGRVT